MNAASWWYWTIYRKSVENFGRQRRKLSIRTIFCAEQRGEEAEEEKWGHEQRVEGKENTDEGILANKEKGENQSKQKEVLCSLFTCL